MDESGTTAGRDVVDLHGTAEWQVLTERFAHLRGSHLRELFAAEPDRGTTMTATAGDLVLDYSKHRVDRAALDALFAVARRAGVAERREPADGHQEVQADREDHEDRDLGADGEHVIAGDER